MGIHIETIKGMEKFYNHAEELTKTLYNMKAGDSFIITRYEFKYGCSMIKIHDVYAYIIGEFGSSQQILVCGAEEVRDTIEEDIEECHNWYDLDHVNGQSGKDFKITITTGTN